MEEKKDWKVAMRKSYYNAVSAAVTPNMVWGSTIERDIATRLNFDSSNSTRSAVSTMSETQFKLGKQLGALSKAVISDKLDKAEEVLVIRKLDMIPPIGTFNAKFNAVMAFFGANGNCFLEGIKEFDALSTEKRIVYIRFWTKKAKFNAEAKLKAFKLSNTGCQFIVARPTLEKFPSDIRQSRDEIRSHLYKLYVNSLKFNGLGKYEPSYEAFTRAIFLDEKYVWEKGTLKMWIEFTDPTNTVAVLSYSFGSDPFSGFEWNNSIPNPRFREKHPEDDYSIVNWGVNVLNEHVK